MRPASERASARRLSSIGKSDGAVSRITGVPRETVRDWRRRTDADGALAARDSRCPLCSRVALNKEAYAYLLQIFCQTCDNLGVHWTRPAPTKVSIARRTDVARLDAWGCAKW